MTDPTAQFNAWLDEAKRHKAITEPTAMCLATATPGGRPSARMVLLKSADDRGFVFYTNLESRKSAEIKANPHAALCFYWMALGKQVRVEGSIAPVSAEEADAYFQSRPLMSKIGAWASRQSQPESTPGEFAARIKEFTQKFISGEVPRPPFWSGWRVVPHAIEFWQQGDFRLHRRELFTREGEGWSVRKLYP